MAAAYFDSSAVVKRYVNEVGSAWVRRALGHPTQESIYTALLTHAEVLSALQRKVRERQLTQDRATVLAQRVTAHCAWRYHLLAISPSGVAHAGVLLQRYPLRAYDAIHLAGALLVQRQAQQHGVPLPRFVSADATLLTAARAEGFTVDNPLQHP